MRHSLKELAALLGAETLGDASIIVTGLAEPASAGPDDLAIAIAPKFASQLAEGRARAAVVWAGADLAALGVQGAIVAPRGRLAMAGLTQRMDPSRDWAALAGVHPSCVIDPTAQIAEGAAIGPFVAIAAGAVIGAGARIASHVSIGVGVRIGARATIGPGVRILSGVRIGDDTMLHPNVVLGGDGFSFTTAQPNNVERAVRLRGGQRLDPPESQHWHRIHSLGGVEIGDSVEIGSNTTVDAGTIRATRIGHGTKLDNLCQVGHNVVIGRDCLLCSGVAVAGSVVIGDRVILGGNTGVADNITIGNDVVSGGAAKVFQSVPDGTFVSGFPAQPTHEYRRGLKALRRLIRGEDAQ